MNALKAHYRYVAEQEAKELERKRKEELERIEKMTPEEREEYEKEQSEKRKRMFETLSLPLAISAAAGIKPYYK